MKAVLVLVVTATSLQAQSLTAARIDSIVTRATAGKIVGLTVGVMQGGKVIFAKGYGVRDLTSKAPVTPRTMFAIGSVTKQFTCSAALMLAEQGKLSFADPVSKYYPNLTSAKAITLLDLGGHLSGYRDYYPLDFVDQEMQKPATADEIIRRYATRPLDFAPRSRYSYSNTGFLILGRVIERVSGEQFGPFITKRIFTPLGMTRTAYEPSLGGEDMARGYTSYALAEPIAADPEAKGWAGAAGALWSTPTDLLTWDLSLIDHKLISAKSYATLATPQRLTDGRTSGYGCGEAVNDRGNAVVLSHGGAVSGFVAQNAVIPATRSAVVMLSNTDFSPIYSAFQDILNQLLPRSSDIVAVRGLATLDAATKFLRGLEQGTVDRETLAEDFDSFLTRDKIAAGRKALNALGPIKDIRIGSLSERGGMEVAGVLFRAGEVDVRAVMFRSTDGKIQEFLIARN
jgi:CubicO group peptidase (beta-lactamase class C family)